MIGFPNKSAGVMAAAVLAVGLAAAMPARADTWRTDCLGDRCVRTHCDDDGLNCTRTTAYTTRTGETKQEYSRTTSYTSPPYAEKAARYACDVDGGNCHWTRSYYLDDDGNAVYDPGMTSY